MPAKSKAQARFFRAEEARKMKGQATKTKMSLSKMEEFTEGVPTHNLPERIKSKKKKRK